MKILQRPNQEETRARWKNLEAAVAEKIGGRKTPGSGSKSVKNDVQNSNYTIECKYRWNTDEHNKFYIELEMQWLEALYRYAEKQQKVPVLALEWGDGSRACLIPYDDYHEHIGGDIEPTIELSSRSPAIPSYLTDRATPINFGSIEVPEHLWVMFPWEGLSWLRLEELKVREEMGKKGTTFKGNKRILPPRSFPKKVKKYDKE